MVELETGTAELLGIHTSPFPIRVGPISGDLFWTYRLQGTIVSMMALLKKR